jgi:hypothetical protein
MRATIYNDGVKRINAKIEIPLSDEDVSDYILSAIVSDVIDLKELQRLNKRQLLQVAKDEIRVMGTEQPKYRISTVDKETDIIVRNYVKQMFPELQ